MVARLILPWPPKELSPNFRAHWAKLARAKKAYREACARAAREQGARPIKADKLHLSLTFYAPTRRAYDLAKKHDVSLGTIKSIRIGRTWQDHASPWAGLGVGNA